MNCKDERLTINIGFTVIVIERQKILYNPRNYEMANVSCAKKGAYFFPKQLNK